MGENHRHYRQYELLLIKLLLIELKLIDYSSWRKHAVTFTRVLKTALLLTITLWCISWIGSALAATEIGDDEYIIFYHHDVLGSPLVVTDHNGNTLWHEQSDPYGKSRDRVMPTGEEFLNDHAGSRTGYTGHLKDSGSDLVYMKARYYDPAIGRFYSNDPVGFTDSSPMMFNRYAYANNNPYVYVDPNGESALKAFSTAYRIGKKSYTQYRKTGKLDRESLKDIGLDEIADIAEDLNTLFGGSAAPWERALAAADLIVGTNASSKKGKVTNSTGKKISNCELCSAPNKRGNAPIGNDGHPVELHHRNQKSDGPIDEMTRTDHRLGENFKKNHSNTGQEASKIDRAAWGNQQKQYWRNEYDSGRFDGL